MYYFWQSIHATLPAPVTEIESMIKIIPIQEAYKKKIERQEKVAGLKFQCYGSCAYIGEDVSPGCYPCFHSDACSYGFMLGRHIGLPSICNRDCVYCFEPHQVQQNYSVPDEWTIIEEQKDRVRRTFMAARYRITTDCKMQYYEFTGVAEPLLYFPVLEEWMKFFRNEIDPLMGTKGWAKIYTNGILLDQDIDHRWIILVSVSPRNRCNHLPLAHR